MSKNNIIKTICDNLDSNKSLCVNIINNDYPFVPIVRQSRQISDTRKVNIFLRDAFIDRYSGDKLVYPAVLRLLSYNFPDQFPYQKNWDMAKCHIAYWELIPSLDHILPIARGGSNDEENIVCTSMKRNSVKSNFTLEEIGWSLHPSGNLIEWDGMISWYVDYIENHPSFLEESYFSHWYKIAKKCLKEFSK